MNSIKRLNLSLLILLIIFSVSGCAATKENETYFIHGAAFSKDKDGIKATILFEQLSGDKSEYFVSEKTAKTVETVSETINNAFRECYFATCSFYLFVEDTDIDFLQKFSKELCNGNDFPLTSDVFYVHHASPKEILKTVKSGKDLNSFMSKLSKHRTNIIRHFADITSGKDSKVTAISLLGKDKKISFGKAIVSGKEGVIFEDN